MTLGQAATRTTAPARRVGRRVGRARWRRYLVASVAVVFLVGLVLISVFAPLPHDPFTPDAGAILHPPNGTYWFGTDRNGLDVFSRTVVAARTDISMAVAGSFLSVLIGVPLGLLASIPGRTAEWLMRLVDTWQAFPLLILVLAIVALSGASPFSVVLALLLVNVPLFVRVVRAEAMVIRSKRYVEAATACGASPRRVALRHILPNTTSVIFAQLSLSAALAILVIAGLGFLGAGLNPPAASWGALVNAGSQSLVSGQWWPALFPSLAILAVVLSFNALADGFYLLTNPAAGRR